MSELQALRTARSMTALKRVDYLRAAEKLPECPARGLLATSLEACDEAIATLSGMIEARDPSAPKDWDMSEVVTS